ncbi:MAG: cytochrome c oxidase subunit 3 [Gammaproteobacteria bacterium]|nr:cytochrome c oxidase subunit 3 [Gammaproteobacteria bacterium]
MTTDIHHDETSSKVIFGFWAYILTDFIMFAALFATYIVLRNNTFGSIDASQVASLHYVLIQTMYLLAANFTFGLCLVASHSASKARVMLWMGVTFLLALGFLRMEQHQFCHLIANGYTWQTSAFLSAFFTLLSIHGIHVIVALLWMVIVAIQLSMHGLTTTMKTRLTCLGLFINFITMIWIVIFTLVYLMGAI